MKRTAIYILLCICLILSSYWMNKTSRRGIDTLENKLEVAREQNNNDTESLEHAQKKLNMAEGISQFTLVAGIGILVVMVVCSILLHTMAPLSGYSYNELMARLTNVSPKNTNNLESGKDKNNTID